MYTFLIEFYTWEFELYSILSAETNKQMDVCGLFHDRQVMEAAKFDAFHT